MKYSEGLFEFPIKVYDSISLARAMLKDDKNIKMAVEDEEMIDSLTPEETDWVRGYAKLPINEIVGWQDMFPEGKTVKEVADNGFEETLVLTRTKGEYECLWDRKKFQERLDEFVEKYAEGIDKMVNDMMEQKTTLAVEQDKKRRNNKTSWWKL